MAALTRDQTDRLEVFAQYLVGIVLGAGLAVWLDMGWWGVLNLAVTYAILFVVRIIVTKLWNGRKHTVKLTDDEVERVFSGIGDRAVAGDRAAAWEIMRDKQRELDKRKRHG